MARVRQSRKMRRARDAAVATLLAQDDDASAASAMLRLRKRGALEDERCRAAPEYVTALLWRYCC